MALPVAFALTTLNVFSGLKRGEAIRQQAQINKFFNLQNADAADRDAFDSILFGETQVARFQSTIDQAVGNQTAAFEIKNVDSSFGSAADVVEETKLIGRLNKIEIQKQARQRARGFKAQARNFRLNAELGIIQGNSDASAAEFSGAVKGVGTLVGGFQRDFRNTRENERGVG